MSAYSSPSAYTCNTASVRLVKMSDYDENRRSENEAVDLGEKNECSGQWGYIFSQVQSELPAMDSDSETISSTDDAIGVFNRTLPDDKKVQETEIIDKSPNVESPLPVTSVPEAPKIIETKTRVVTAPRSSSLLFQRLQKHLKENVNTTFEDEEQNDSIKMTDEVESSQNELIAERGKNKPSHSYITPEMSLSSICTEFEDIDVSTLLSLERLEKFDLSSIINDAPTIKISEKHSEPSLEEKDTKEKSIVMEKLHDLCMKHEQMDDSHKDGKKMKPEQANDMADHHAAGRTTVFLDLRENANDMEQNEEKPVEPPPIQAPRPQTKSIGVSVNDLPLPSRRVQNMTKMHAVSSGSESSDDDELSQNWWSYRQRIKEKSQLKSVSSNTRAGTDSKFNDKHRTGESSNQSSHRRSVKLQGKTLDQSHFNVNSTRTERETNISDAYSNKTTNLISNSTTSAVDHSSYCNLAGDTFQLVNGITSKTDEKDGSSTTSSASVGSQSYSATRLKENPSYSRLLNPGTGGTGHDSTIKTKKGKSKDKKLQSRNTKKDECCQRPDASSIRNETRYKLKVLLDKEKKQFPQGTYLLFDMTSSFESDVSNLPPNLRIKETQMVVLTINMLTVGQIVLHRSSGGHKATPVDPSVGFSVTYPLLLSWLLALVPEDVNNIQRPRTDDAFCRDLDPHELLEDINGKEQTHIEVPFNVVSLNQYWREDIQSLSLTAVIVPNDFYNPDTKRLRKKSKKEDAFLSVVRQFLQSNKVQDVCPWHERPESPLHYTLSEMDVTCAMKPLSTYVAASNEPTVIKKALKSTPGFYSKLMTVDDNTHNMESNANQNSEITMCLLQKEAFMFPIAVFDIGIRLQIACLDLVGLRLCYVARRFIDESTSHYSYAQEVEYQETIVPCAVLAVKGRYAHKKWSKTVGPRDPVLARMSEKLSLNATYGEQLSNNIHSMDANLFYHPRSAARAFQQLCVWFGGRVNPDCGMVKSLSQPIANGVAHQNSVDSNGSSITNSNDEDDSVFKFESFQKPSMLDEFKLDSYISTSCVQKVYLVVSPQLPTRFISDVICTVLHTGYHLIAIKRLRLDERKSSALNIPQRNFPYFCPRLDPDASLDFDYYEDVWLFRPSTVLLISKENGIIHQSGLIHALQSDLIISLSSPDEGHVKQLTCQCFHTTSYSDNAEHVINVMNKAMDGEIASGLVKSYANFPNISPSPEMEQVVVFGAVGDEAIDEGSDILRSLAHGDFACTEDDMGIDIHSMDSTDEEYEMEPFNGFEVLGIKRLSSLPKNLANELCYFEVGTEAWSRNIIKLQNSPVLLMVLRRVNAFQVLRRILSSMRTSNPENGDMVCLEDFPFTISSSPVTSYRQVNAFFTDKELFPDNQSRPLLKYLPPPARLLQYRLHQKIKPTCSCGSNGVCSCSQSNGVSQPTENVKRGSSKKKKKNGKKDANYKDAYHNGDGTISAKHLSSLDESIYSFMTTCNQPLTSIIVIKPDAFPRHFIKIMQELHRQDFTIVAMNLVKLSEHEALQIAPTIIKEMQGECQVYLDHMISDLSVVACVQRTNAIRHLRELAGPHNPQIARSRCYSRRNYNTTYTRKRASLRALFGIDLISNGIHVSDSYASACEEMKLFFPNGLCCKETQELAMECVPCPAFDPYMCAEKMKGREARTPIYGGSTGKRKSHMKDEICEPLLAILMPGLLQNGTAPSSTSENHLLNGWKTPAYIDILDQLFNQGFEVCAMRMAWCRQDQAQKLIHMLQCKGNNKKYIDQMLKGPVLIVLMQRKNAFLLFDAVLGSSKSNGDSLFYKHSESILRSKSVDETKQAAQYIFSYIPNLRSVLKISHNRMGWNVSCGDELEKSKD